MPGPSQHAIDANGKVVDNIEAAVMLQQRKPGDRTSARSYSYNDAAKRRTQYYEEQFQYKDNAVLQSREKVVRHSPVIAELKTNVIVSTIRLVFGRHTALMWLAVRLKTSSRWSPTSRTTSLSGIPDPIRQS